MSVPIQVTLWKRAKDLLGWLTPEDLEELKNTPVISVGRLALQARIVHRNSFIIEALEGLKKGHNVYLWNQPDVVLIAFQRRVRDAADMLSIDASALMIQQVTSEEMIQLQQKDDSIWPIKITGSYSSSAIYNLLPDTNFSDL